MMEKFEFSDLYKFLVSIGLVLVGSSFLIPYFFLKEDFGLYIEQEKFLKFPKTIQDIILTKEDNVIWFQKIIHSSSFILFFLGIIISAFGLFKWWNRQKKVDQKFDLEISELGLKIKAMSSSETEQKAKMEIEDRKTEEYILKTETGKFDVKTGTLEVQLTKEDKLKENVEIKEYIKVEEEVFLTFKSYNSPFFEVLHNQKINNVGIDLFTRSKNISLYRDKLIEIKYFDKRIFAPVLKSALTFLTEVTNNYTSFSQRSAVPVLLIIHKVDDNIYINDVEYKLSILINRSGFNGKYRFIHKNQIGSIDVRSILSDND